MKILITGGRGQLASDLAAILAAQHQVVAPAHAELDVCEADRVQACLDQERPAVVINTAAFHRVDDCEREVERAFAVNALAVGRLARWCAAHDAVFVHFSTDYVFSGREGTPRAESDVTEPLNVYGASKLAGEHLARQAGERHIVVRTSGLYGIANSAGKGGNFVEKMLARAAAGTPIEVVDDQILTPSATADVAAKVVQLIAGQHYGLFHVTNAGSCSWYEFAQRIFALRGLRVDLRPTSSARFRAPARRPAYSVLRRAALERLGLDDLPPWDDALRRYLSRDSFSGDALPR